MNSLLSKFDFPQSDHPSKSFIRKLFGYDCEKGGRANPYSK